MKLGIKAMVDIVFKKVFGSPEHSGVTLAFLNAVLSEFDVPTLTKVTIENPFVLSDFLGDKEIAVDVMATDQSDHRYQIKMQTTNHAGPGINKGLWLG